MKKTDPMVVAILRALPTAILTAGSSLFLLLPTSITTREMIGTVGGVFVAVMMGRGGAEGWYDQKRAPNQNVPPASDLDDW